MNNRTNFRSPAQLLAGKTLDNGWSVKGLIVRPPTSTGGHFSSSYIVQSSNGQKAFLKAMDYKRALASPDPAKALQIMTAAFNFERDLLEKCKSNKLSRIIRVLESGTITAQQNDPSSVVQYLIFELADGDIRTFVNFDQNLDNAWILRTLHQTAAATLQLHRVQVAHQDLKPSNVLLFANNRSKLADLGRAYDRQNNSPHDSLPYAGDPAYAPPELHYGYIAQNWQIRRLACHMYLLGSLVVFFYTGVSMTHLLFKRVAISHSHQTWGDSYEAVLPYLQQIFADILRALPQYIPADFAAEITAVVRQLCDPDPRERGHPKNKSSTRHHSLERYVSLFDLLAKRAEMISKRSTVTTR